MKDGASVDFMEFLWKMRDVAMAISPNVEIS